MALLAENATDREIARAKAQLRSGLLMGLERPSARAESIAAQLYAYGRVLPVAEVTGLLEAVDTAAVRRVGARVMATASPSLAAIGPIGGLETHETFARRFGSATRRAAE